MDPAPAPLPPLAPPSTGGPVLPPDGSPLPPADPGPTPTTPPGQEQTPDGPAGGPGRQPAPTPEQMARELGRIEDKLLQLLRREPPTETGGGGIPAWAGPLIEAILSAGSGTEYLMPRPCDRDENGNQLAPIVVNAPGALDRLGLVLNRIDALAELMAVHKEVKQPNCPGPRAQGQPVTVTFEEVSEV
jgi:hypothetical protein